MKHIFNRNDFINEGLKTDNKHKNRIVNILNFLEYLYELFKGDTGVYLDKLLFKDLLMEHKVPTSFRLSDFDKFLITHGKGSNLTYSLKSNNKPTLKLATYINTIYVKRMKIYDDERKAKIKFKPKFKTADFKVKLKAALQEIKDEIKKNNGNITPTTILRSYYVPQQANRVFIENNIYYNYKLKTDAATLKQVEKHFSKAWKPRIGFPEFSEVKHRLYVWNDVNITDKLINKLHKLFLDMRYDERDRVIAKETDEEKEDRIEMDRVRDNKAMTKMLANETPEERKERKAKHGEYYKKYMKAKIANESPEEREERLAKHNEKQKLLWKKMSPEKKQKAKDRKTELYKIMVANETPEERKERLATVNTYNKSFYAKRDANESSEERKERLARENKISAKSKIKKLANETPEEKEERKRKRREYQQERMANIYANETPGEREERLIKQREYEKKKLSEETPEQHKIRIAKQLVYDRKKKSLETYDERKARTEREKNRKKAILDNETTADKEIRKKKRKEAYLQRLANESPEHKEKRQAKDREIKKKIREEKKKNI